MILTIPAIIAIIGGILAAIGLAIGAYFFKERVLDGLANEEQVGAVAQAKALTTRLFQELRIKLNTASKAKAETALKSLKEENQKIINDLEGKVAEKGSLATAVSEAEKKADEAQKKVDALFKEGEGEKAAAGTLHDARVATKKLEDDETFKNIKEQDAEIIKEGMFGVFNPDHLETALNSIESNKKELPKNFVDASAKVKTLLDQFKDLEKSYEEVKNNLTEAKKSLDEAKADIAMRKEDNYFSENSEAQAYEAAINNFDSQDDNVKAQNAKTLKEDVVKLIAFLKEQLVNTKIIRKLPTLEEISAGKMPKVANAAYAKNAEKALEAAKATELQDIPAASKEVAEKLGEQFDNFIKPAPAATAGA